jgi:hypothetical protein
VEPIERFILQNSHPSVFSGADIDRRFFNVPKNRTIFLPSPVQINEHLSCLIGKKTENYPMV